MSRKGQYRLPGPGSTQGGASCTPPRQRQRRWRGSGARWSGRPPLGQAPAAPATPRNLAIARSCRDWIDPDKVIAIYRACAVLNEIGPETYCVDHIVPIQGTRVCGLHVHDNLQVITVEENRQKGNWWWPQMSPPPDEDEEDLVSRALQLLIPESRRLHFTM